MKSYSEQYYCQKLEAKARRKARLDHFMGQIVPTVIVTVGIGVIILAVVLALIGGTAYLSTGQTKVNDLEKRVHALEWPQTEERFYIVTNR